jgi:single-strand DNA-binding protein
MPNSAVLQIEGHVGKAPESKQSKGGKLYISFSVAVNNNRKNEEGKWETVSTDWFDVFAWDNLDSIAEKIDKGTAVRVSGRPSVSPYIAKDGQAKASMQISAKSVSVICYDKKEGGYRSQEPPEPAQTWDLDSDEIPF